MLLSKSSKQIWTFRLSGGNPFYGQIDQPDTFPSVIDHPGGKVVTLVSLSLTEEEASQLEKLIKQHNINVSCCSTEASTERDLDQDHNQ